MSIRINDREANELVSGAMPAGRSELGGLAELITEVREASAAVSAPVPSAQLESILDRGFVPLMSNTDSAVVASSSIAVAATVKTGAWAAFIMGVQKMIKWPSGLELPSKIALGAGLVVAAATGVGVAGALPGPAQSAFDLVVSPVTGESVPGELPPPAPGDDKNNDGTVGVVPEKPKDPSPSPTDKPQDPVPSPTEKPKDPVPPPADKPKDPAPIVTDKPKDPTPPPTEKPKDPTPPPTEKPKDPTPPPTEKPKDPTPPPTEKPISPTPPPTEEPKLPPAG